MSVTLVELKDSVLGGIDRDIAAYVASHFGRAQACWSHQPCFPTPPARPAPPSPSPAKRLTPTPTPASRCARCSTPAS